MLSIEELENKLNKLREVYKNGDSCAKTKAHYMAIPLKMLLNKKRREKPQIPLN
jgi:hypothetical protein